MLGVRDDWADRAEERRAEAARSCWYWDVSCSRRDSCWVLSWLSWSRDMVSMFMALPPEEDWDEEDDMAEDVQCSVWLVVGSDGEKRTRT